jgi:hypothetical protein
VQLINYDSSIAWALRGKSVTTEDHLLQSDAPYFRFDPSYFQFLVLDHVDWGHRHNGWCKTERMLALLDSDVFIGQKL